VCTAHHSFKAPFLTKRTLTMLPLLRAHLVAAALPAHARPLPRFTSGPNAQTLVTYQECPIIQALEHVATLFPASKSPNCAPSRGSRSPRPGHLCAYSIRLTSLDSDRSQRIHCARTVDVTPQCGEGRSRNSSDTKCYLTSILCSAEAAQRMALRIRMAKLGSLQAVASCPMPM